MKFKKKETTSSKTWNGLTTEEWELYDKEDFAGTGEEFKKVLSQRKSKAK